MQDPPETQQIHQSLSPTPARHQAASSRLLKSHEPKLSVLSLIGAVFIQPPSRASTTNRSFRFQRHKPRIPEAKRNNAQTSHSKRGRNQGLGILAKRGLSCDFSGPPHLGTALFKFTGERQLG